MGGETRGFGTGEEQTPFMKDVSKVGGVVANVLRKINSAMEVAGAGVGDYFEGTNLMDTAGPRFDKAWGLNNNTPAVTTPVQPVAKQVTNPGSPVNTQPVEPVTIMPSVTSPVVVTPANSAAPLGVGEAKPFDPDPTGRIQRERDSAYANTVMEKNNIQNDIDRIMYERKLDEMTNWAGRGLGIGQYQSKYGADVLPELMKLKEGANLNASRFAQESVADQSKNAYGLENQRVASTAQVQAAKYAADATRGEHVANRELENKKLEFEVSKFAKTNDMKDPINYLKLASSLAKRPTTDENGVTVFVPDVEAGATVLEKLGYPAPAGIKVPKPPTIWEQAKGTLSAGMNKPETDMKKLRKDVVGILKTKGFTDSQIEEGLK